MKINNKNWRNNNKNWRNNNKNWRNNNKNWLSNKKNSPAINNLPNPDLFKTAQFGTKEEVVNNEEKENFENIDEKNDNDENIVQKFINKDPKFISSLPNSSNNKVGVKKQELNNKQYQEDRNENLTKSNTYQTETKPSSKVELNQQGYLARLCDHLRSFCGSR